MSLTDTLEANIMRTSQPMRGAPQSYPQSYPQSFPQSGPFPSSTGSLPSVYGPPRGEAAVGVAEWDERRQRYTFPDEEPPSAPQGNRFLWALAVLVLAIVVDVIALVLAPPSLNPVVSEIGQITGYAVAAACCIAAVARSPRGRVRQAWVWIAVAFACNLIAELIYGYLVIVQHQADPFPTLADAFYLLFYPLMAIGVVLLPTAPMSGLHRFLLALDALIVAAALLSVSWFFLLGPTFFQGADTPLNLAISLAYPAGDLALMVALYVLALRGFDSRYRPVYWWLLAGMIVSIVADSAYTYLGLQNAYSSGTVWLDPLWPAGAFLMGLAPLYQLSRFSRSGATLARLPSLRERGEAESASPSFVRLLLPYLPVAALFVLLWLGQRSDIDARLLPLLDALAAVVVGLIIVRQVMTLYQNVQLTRQQAGSLGMLEDANARIAGHAHELEEALQHLNAVQARIAQGDFSARVPVLSGGLLYPVTSMLNRMLDRVEGRAHSNQNNEQLANLALQLAQICRAAETGDITALQALAQPSGTQLDAVARLLLVQRQRIAELQDGRGDPASRPHSGGLGSGSAGGWQ
jgi:hypothetical protein